MQSHNILKALSDINNQLLDNCYSEIHIFRDIRHRWNINMQSAQKGSIAMCDCCLWSKFFIHQNKL